MNTVDKYANEKGHQNFKLTIKQTLFYKGKPNDK